MDKSKEINDVIKIKGVKKNGDTFVTTFKDFSNTPSKKKAVGILKTLTIFKRKNVD